MSRPVASARPNLGALPASEVDRRRRAAAELPTPRDVCPGCLRDLRGFPRQQAAGWCRLCHLSQDRILRDLLRAPDAKWRKPEAVALAEAEVEAARVRAERLRAQAEAAARDHAGKAAGLRYLRARLRVCLDCGEAAAEPTTMTCFACGDWRPESGKET